jgi:hypothetical protein
MTQKRVGYVLSGLAVLFLVFDTTLKLLQVTAAVEAMPQLGYPGHLLLTIGVIELGCLLLYVIPPTSVLGAVLLTGFLGGAVATHLRIGNSLAGHILFPTYVAAFVWGGLLLRETRLRALFPLRR